jgi:hypothetical protein
MDCRVKPGNDEKSEPFEPFSEPQASQVCGTAD